MTPALVNTATYTPPPPPVYAGAMTPGASVVRASIVSVAPSVANVQVGNDARNTPATATPVAPSSLSVPVAGLSGAQSVVGYFNSGIGSQTSFFTQLIAQDTSAQARGVLVEYEKLVAMGKVKYLPSNAGIPEPEPNNIFAQALRQERAATPAQYMQQVQTQMHQAVAVESSVASMASPAVQPAKSSSRVEAKAVTREVRSMSAYVAAAYVTSARRNDAQLNQQTVKDVEQV
jgi:hypothetical protein